MRRSIPRHAGGCSRRDGERCGYGSNCRMESADTDLPEPLSRPAPGLATLQVNDTCLTAVVAPKDSQIANFEKGYHVACLHVRSSGLYEWAVINPMKPAGPVFPASRNGADSIRNRASRSGGGNCPMASAAR